MKAVDLELALAKHLRYRQNVVVPNASWGAGLRHEADIFTVSKAGYASEYEIKVSRSDLRAEFKKAKWTLPLSKRIKYMWFAVTPELLDLALETVPQNCGIVVVHRRGNYKHFQNRYKVEVIRKAQANPEARKWSPREISGLYRLTALRIWRLKDKLLQAPRP